MTHFSRLINISANGITVSMHQGRFLISASRLMICAAAAGEASRRAPKVTVTRSGESEGVVAPKHLLPGFCCSCSGSWALEQGPSGTRSRPAAELSEPQLAAAGRVECE